jgi:hypothetical protein
MGQGRRAGPLRLGRQVCGELVPAAALPTADFLRLERQTCGEVLDVKTGDRVRKRGFQHVGTIAGISAFDTKWIHVKWDPGQTIPKGQGPTWCAPGELEVIK